MSKIETIESVVSDSVRYVGHIFADTGAPDPRDMGMLGNISVFDTRTTFWNHMESMFGKNAQHAVSSMVDGQVLWTGPGGMKPVIGIERYSHSGDVYAACKKGAFPDRQWDVSPIVGSYEITDKDILTRARKLKRDGNLAEADALLQEMAKSDLDVFNQWCAGDVYYFRLERHDHSGVEEIDSCGDIYGLDEVKQMMEEARLADMATKQATPSDKIKARM